jgi:hypothetical protein
MVAIATQVLPVSDRRFFTNISLLLAAFTFAGFARTYYLAQFNEGPGPVLTNALHIHGALCTAWVVLLVVQTRLIAVGRRALHRTLGLLGAVVAIGILASGVFVALNATRRVHTSTTADTLADPYVFLIFPLTTVALFAVFVLLAVLKRHRPDAHKRYMLLATASLIVPAMARMTNQAASALGIVLVPGVVGAVILQNIFLIALVLHDFRTRGKLHPVTLWAGGILLLSEPLRFAIGFSAPWQAFARTVMG